MHLDRLNQPDDPGWSPTSAVPEFQLQGNTIHDVKGVPFSTFAAWDARPVGRFYMRTQDIRLVWTDPCGTQHIKNVGSFVLFNAKVSNTEWEIQY